MTEKSQWHTYLQSDWQKQQAPAQPLSSSSLLVFLTHETWPIHGQIKMTVVARVHVNGRCVWSHLDNRKLKVFNLYVLVMCVFLGQNEVLTTATPQTTTREQQGKLVSLHEKNTFCYLLHPGMLCLHLQMWACWTEMLDGLFIDHKPNCTSLFRSLSNQIIISLTWVALSKVVLQSNQDLIPETDSTFTSSFHLLVSPSS